MITPPAPTGQVASRLSADTLIGLLLVASTIVVMALSAAILLAADRADMTFADTIKERLLERLERDGISGLAAEIERLDSSLVPGSERVELALWRLGGGEQRLIRESAEGFAEAALRSDRATFDGATFAVIDVDIAAASRSWAIPMQDARLLYGISQPTAETKQARQTLLAIWAIFLVFVTLSLALRRLHRTRYQDGIARVNALLDRYSEGETGIRFSIGSTVPELRVLELHLNNVLPKLDGLMDDLRNTSAHLAHELRTPLQIMRTELAKMKAAETSEARKALVRAIDQRIDRANARLDTVMQLFRLTAGSKVVLEDQVDLADAVTEAFYDVEEALLTQGRTASLETPEMLHLRGNRRLIELMLQNIFSNIRRYTPEGGSIAIRLHAKADRFVLTAENTGVLADGLSGDIFKRFAQGAGHAGKTGAGLGLSLIKAIAEVHGFDLVLEQAGDTVRLTLVGALDRSGHAA